MRVYALVRAPRSSPNVQHGACHFGGHAAIIRALMTPHGIRMAMPKAPPGSDGA